MKKDDNSRGIDFFEGYKIGFIDGCVDASKNFQNCNVLNKSSKKEYSNGYFIGYEQGYNSTIKYMNNCKEDSKQKIK